MDSEDFWLSTISLKEKAQREDNSPGSWIYLQYCRDDVPSGIWKSETTLQSDWTSWNKVYQGLSRFDTAACLIPSRPWQFHISQCRGDQIGILVTKSNYRLRKRIYSSWSEWPMAPPKWTLALAEDWSDWPSQTRRIQYASGTALLVLNRLSISNDCLPCQSRLSYEVIQWKCMIASWSIGFQRGHFIPTLSMSVTDSYWRKIFEMQCPSLSMGISVSIGVHFWWEWRWIWIHASRKHF
jgi:hypothetical protein